MAGEEPPDALDGATRDPTVEPGEAGNGAGVGVVTSPAGPDAFVLVARARW